MEQQTYHWHIARRALDLIDAQGAEAPSLAEIAAEMGLSPAHFQRVFSAQVGVSPKRYQQYLALGHARALLATRHTTFDTAQEVGLSGGARLHDLFLRWEAMSPGDYARGGAGLTIRWGVHETPFGPALAMATDKGLCGLGFCAETGVDAAYADLSARWPKADYVEDPAHTGPMIDTALNGGDLSLHLMGAPFQIKVWEALLQIPEGHVSTYTDVARAAGKPRAARAAGTAVGRNPLSLLIPCHRVITRDGRLGGYHWGLPVKRALLAWETARAG